MGLILVPPADATNPGALRRAGSTDIEEGHAGRASAPPASTYEGASSKNRKRARGRTWPGRPTPAGTSIRDLQTQPARGVLTSYIFRALLTNLLHKSHGDNGTKISVRETVCKGQAFAIPLALLDFPRVPVTNKNVLTNLGTIPYEAARRVEALGA